nr:5'-amp-activated protein kinase catalytic subunit alpha-2 [Quercus suber]
MIVMEYFPCGNMLDAGISDRPRCLSAFGQILAALDHLHEKGIVHRDLKPENLLVQLQPFFKVVIADFGLANITRGKDGLHSHCGTDKYMAPEVIPGVRDGHGTPTDIWSLGVIGIEWIYNCPRLPQDPAPMVRQDTQDSRWKRWVQEWTTNLRVALVTGKEGRGRLTNILSHMVRLEPEERWTAKECLAEGLKTGLFKKTGPDGLIISA